MKHRDCHVPESRRPARLHLVTLAALAALLALPLQAQEAADKRTVDARASTAAYTPESSRSDGAAQAGREKRKPRWFDERRQKVEKPAANASFERLSYTRYEGEADQNSGICVYYQSSYTYSCR
jgi:hypothetical protein